MKTSTRGAVLEADGPRPPAVRAAGRSADTEAMAREIAECLQRRPLPEIPSKYLYDARGSALFEEITRLPEYYLTRAEERILEARADDIVAASRPRELVELGSGSGRKTRRLLEALRAAGGVERVVLFDVDEGALRSSTARLERDYPETSFSGVVGDFLHDLPALGPGGRRLLLFLAGTIGNVHPYALPAFFRSAAEVLAPGDTFLVGVDVVKDKARLEAAYNDGAGVTAAFNKNILSVLNRRLGADFDERDFDHVAFYDEARQWIEMRLRARQALTARVPRAEIVMHLERGQEIRTELSCKYSRASFEARLRGSGLRLERWMTDAAGSFASALLRRDVS